MKIESQNISVGKSWKLSRKNLSFTNGETESESLKDNTKIIELK